MGCRWCCGQKEAGIVVILMGALIVPMLNGQDKKERGAASQEVFVAQGQEDAKVSKDVLSYEIEMIDGSTKSLEDFRGRVLMFVNVASACGLTPQYQGLEAMYKKYKDDGFVIIGFPANEFGAQEPGTNEEIAQFCSNEYGVTFPMAAKIVVKGDGVHPLYEQLAAQPEPIGGEPEWNFAKFLVNREGEVVERYPSRTPPEDVDLVASVEVLLGDE